MQDGFGPRETWQEKMQRCLSAPAGIFRCSLSWTQSWRVSSGIRASTRSASSSTGARRTRGFPRASTGNDQWVQTLLLPLERAGVEPYAVRLKAKPDEILSMFEANEINVVVGGGETQGAWKILGVRHQATVSVDAWR
jgi:hypothetical protein